jgi:hypothetical protein
MGNEGGNTFFSIKLQSCCGWEEYCIRPHQPPSSHRIKCAGDVRFCNISAHYLSPASRIHMICTPADDFQLDQHMRQKFKRNHFNNIHWSIIEISCNVNGIWM